MQSFLRLAKIATIATIMKELPREEEHVTVAWTEFFIVGKNSFKVQRKISLQTAFFAMLQILIITLPMRIR